MSLCSAFRALEKSGSEEIGGALVSFANSAKQVDYQGRNGMNQMPRPNNPVGRVMPAIRPGPGPPVFPPGRGGGGRGLLPGRGPVLTPGPCRMAALPYHWSVLQDIEVSRLLSEHRMYTATLPRQNALSSLSTTHKIICSRGKAGWWKGCSVLSRCA